MARLKRLLSRAIFILRHELALLGGSRNMRGPKRSSIYMKKMNTILASAIVLSVSGAALANASAPAAEPAKPAAPAAKAAEKKAEPAKAAEKKSEPAKAAPAAPAAPAASK